MRTFILVVAVVILFVIARLSVFTVDRTEFVYLTQFGRPVAIYDGASPAEAGLHFKWPWPIQTITRIDHRLQHLDLAGAELLTHDPKGNTIDKTLTIDAYVCWRVADKKLDESRNVAAGEGVDRFVRAVGTAEQARTLLRQQVSSELGAVVARMELD